MRIFLCINSIVILDNQIRNMKFSLFILSFTMPLALCAQKNQSIQFSSNWDEHVVFLGETQLDTSEAALNYYSGNRAVSLVMNTCEPQQLRFEKEGHRTQYRLLRPRQLKSLKRRKEDCAYWEYRDRTTYNVDLVQEFAFNELAFNIDIKEFTFDYNLMTFEFSSDGYFTRDQEEEEENFKVDSDVKFDDRYSSAFCKELLNGELTSHPDTSRRFNLSGIVKQVSHRTDMRANFLSHEINLIIHWVLTNEDGATIFESFVEGNSGEILSEESAASETIQQCLSNALLNSFHSAFSDEEERIAELSEVFTWEVIPLTETQSSVSSVKEATKALVSISFGEEEMRTTGIFITDRGHILTSAFYFHEDSIMSITTNDNRNHQGKLIRMNRLSDVMIIQIDTTSNQFLSMPSEKNFGMAENVFAISNPKQELGQSLSKGIVSGERNMDGIKFIQSDVRISPESIGGALVSEDGTKFYGMISDKAVGFGVEGIAFILRADFIREVLLLQ